MNPCLIVQESCRTLTTGVTQLVVQDASDTTSCFLGSYLSRFTPGTTVMSGFLAGAETRTFLAPPFMCLAAASRFVKSPVDSTTTSTPCFDQGISLGSFTERILTSLPSTLNPSGCAVRVF